MQAPDSIDPTERHLEYPFGNPDGSRAPIVDVLDGFVSFGGGAAWGGLGMRPDDLTARVIVGRKGSGKTVYLRRLRAYARTHDSLYAEGYKPDKHTTAADRDFYADDVQQGLPATSQIVRFCQYWNFDNVTEKWMGLWRCAILRSVVSHLVCNPHLTSYLNDQQKSTLTSRFSRILRDFHVPMSIYSQVSEIINFYDTANAMAHFIDDPYWPELEYHLADLLHACPPVAFYIDAVDEEFAHAPMEWHRCQKGLFYQVMRFLRDSRLGGRLHIVICIRDIVLSSIYQSEHGSRYRNEPHIRILNWNEASIKHFLVRKLDKLQDARFLIKPDRSEPMIKWLGIKKTYNDTRRVQEDVLPYVLRHTRLLPRDIVSLGNAICTEIYKSRIGNTTPFDRKSLRIIIDKEARFMGMEQIHICANQIAAHSMPKKAGLHGYSETYTGDEEYIRRAAEELRDLLGAIGKDRVSAGELSTLCDFAREEFGHKIDLPTVLWQNGLLGYTDCVTQKSVFFHDMGNQDFHMPGHKGEYVFHSILSHAVGLKLIGKPV